MKKSMISLAVATAMISLVGCGNQIPDMTQEQQALVVEYAAGEILKYDKIIYVLGDVMVSTLI